MISISTDKVYVTFC